mmetsp:Transcript_13512/g.31519  ORF Transcript_13512/g.31519 Transcript_13512/m.31519 type:complete len:223 (+) Transcript_13512:987-1655(+)
MPVCPSKFMAADPWTTTRASPRWFAASLSADHRSLVRRKCDSWLTCICMSNLSSVTMSGRCMMPALSASTSRPSEPTISMILGAALRTLLNDMRSQSTWYTSAPNALRLARAASEREEGRLRQMIRALCRAAIIASVYPVPVVQPVMAIVLNCMSGSLSSNVCTVPLNGLQQQHPISKLRPSNGSGRSPLPLGEITDATSGPTAFEVGDIGVSSIGDESFFL